MAEITYAVTTTPGGDQLITWGVATEADTFQQCALEEVVSEISCHVTGTFGGATVTFTGGNVPTNMVSLLQLGGATAAATADDLFSLLDRPLYIQPSHSGGTSESVTIYMLVRK